MKNRRTILLLLGSFLLLMALTIGLGINKIYEYSDQEITANKMHDDAFSVSRYARDITTDIMKMHRSMKDVALAADEIELEATYAIVNDLEKEVLNRFTILQSHYLGNIADIYKADYSFKRWRHIRDDIYMLAKSGQKDKAAYVSKHRGAEYVERLLHHTQILIEHADRAGLDYLNAVKQHVKEDRDEMVRFLVVFTVIGLLVSLLVTRYISRLLEVIKKKNRHLQDSLRELQVKTEDLISTQSIAKVGSWRLEHSTNELSWSQEVFNIFGLNADTDTLKSEEYIGLVHPDDLEDIKKAYETSFVTKTPLDIVYRIVLKESTIKYVKARSTTLYDENGIAVRTLGSIQDISDEVKQKEHQKEQSRLAQMGEMLSMIAHQWRQPLTTISAVASDIKIRLELGTLNDEIIEQKTDKILEHIQYLSATINDFRDFFKQEKGKKYLNSLKHFRIPFLCLRVFLKRITSLSNKNLRHLDPLRTMKTRSYKYC